MDTENTICLPRTPIAALAPIHYSFAVRGPNPHRYDGHSRHAEIELVQKHATDLAVVERDLAVCLQPFFVQWLGQNLVHDIIQVENEQHVHGIEHEVAIGFRGEDIFSSKHQQCESEQQLG